MRRDDLRTSIIIICFMVFIAVIVVFGCIQPANASLPRMEPLTATFTADDDCIKAYIIRDPDTQVEYIVTDHGGITQRVK